MEILKNLSEEELNGLRRCFENNRAKSLNESEFKEVLLSAIAGKKTTFTVTNEYLQQLFDSVDVAGTGRVGWHDFSLFSIDQATCLVGSGFTTGLGTGAASRSNRKKNSKKNKHRTITDNSTEGPVSGATVAAMKLESGTLVQVGSSSPTRATSGAPASPNFLSSVAAAGHDHLSLSGVLVNPTSASNTNSSSISLAGEARGMSRESDEEEEEMEEDEDGAEVSAIDDFSGFHTYHVERTTPHVFGQHIVSMRTLPKQSKMVRVVYDAKGNHSTSVYAFVNGGRELSLYGKLPKQTEVVIDWDHIPPAGGIEQSNSLACSYNGGTIQIFSLEKKHSVDEILNNVKTFVLSETQTCLRWSAMYNRLVLGSRGGVVSVWDVTQNAVSAQEKLHSQSLVALRVRGGMLYTASLDRVNSVKGVDLERSVVRFAFNDHLVGGAMAMECDDEFLFSSGFEARIVQRTLQNPRANPTYLYDAVLPHQGRISCIHRVASTPLLISGDTKGYVKIWDLRMEGCLQTILPACASRGANGLLARKAPLQQGRGPRGRAAGGAAAAGRSQGGVAGAGPGGRLPALETVIAGNSINAVCSLPNLGALLVANSKELISFSSIDSASPDLADSEHACRFVLFPNPNNIVTIHVRSVKMWDTHNGHLLYATGNNLVSSDISCCALIEPLKRQFLLGTQDGDLKGYSIALCEKAFDFAQTLREAGLHGREILAVETLPRFRDYASPYVILTYADGICLVPMVEKARGSAVIRLHSIAAMLDTKHVIRETKLVDGQFFIAVSNGTLAIFDFTHVGVIAAIYTLPSGEAENFFLCRVRQPSIDYAQVARELSKKKKKPAITTTEAEEAEAQAMEKPEGEVAAAMKELIQSNGEKGLPSKTDGRPKGTSFSPLPPCNAHGAQKNASGDARPTTTRCESAVGRASVASGRHTVFFAVGNDGRVSVGEAVTNGGAPPVLPHARAHAVGAPTAAAPLAADDTAPPAALSLTASMLSGSFIMGDGNAKSSYEMLGVWLHTRDEGSWKWQRSSRRTVKVAKSEGGISFYKPQQLQQQQNTGSSASSFTGGGGGTSNTSRRQIHMKSQGQEGLPCMSPQEQSTVDVEQVVAAAGGGAQPSPSQVHGSLRVPIVTHMYFFSGSRTVVTGDDRGQLKLWDIAGVLAAGAASRWSAVGTSGALDGPGSTPNVCSSASLAHQAAAVAPGGGQFWSPLRAVEPAAAAPPSSSAGSARRSGPILIADWYAHEKGFTTVSGFEHSSYQLPVIITGGYDNKVVLWSADGVMLGTLATARQIDDQTNGRRFHLPPYTVPDVSTGTLKEDWKMFLKYVAQRDAGASSQVPPRAAFWSAGAPATGSAAPNQELAVRRQVSVTLTLAEDSNSPARTLGTTTTVQGCSSLSTFGVTPVNDAGQPRDDTGTFFVTEPPAIEAGSVGFLSSGPSGPHMTSATAVALSSGSVEQSPGLLVSPPVSRTQPQNPRDGNLGIELSDVIDVVSEGSFNSCTPRDTGSSSRNSNRISQFKLAIGQDRIVKQQFLHVVQGRKHAPCTLARTGISRLPTLKTRTREKHLQDGNGAATTATKPLSTFQSNTATTTTTTNNNNNLSGECGVEDTTRSRTTVKAAADLGCPVLFPKARTGGSGAGVAYVFAPSLGGNMPVRINRRQMAFQRRNKGKSILMQSWGRISTAKGASTVKDIPAVQCGKNSVHTSHAASRRSSHHSVSSSSSAMGVSARQQKNHGQPGSRAPQYLPSI